MFSAVGADVPVTPFLFTRYKFWMSSQFNAFGFKGINLKFIHGLKRKSFQFTHNRQITVNLKCYEIKVKPIFWIYICVIIDSFISVFINKCFGLKK